MIRRIRCPMSALLPLRRPAPTQLDLTCPCHLDCASDIIAHLAAAATSSEEENSVDAAEEQQSGAHVCGQLALDADMQAAVSPAELPDEPQSRHRPKRHLSRSLDLSRTSISSRPAKQQRLGKVLECMSLVNRKNAIFAQNITCPTMGQPEYTMLLGTMTGRDPAHFWPSIQM